MIRFQDVCKSYPDGTEAVRDFTLEAPTGKTTVLVGSSGCGKTTLLRMVNRMVDPTSGAVWIDDENVADVPPVPLRRRIGYVMQNAGLLPHRKVIDNIATVPLLNGVPKAQAHARAAELMELVGLEARQANRYPDQLSGGQQQRVGVARGLAADPNILLMDEPFGAVDPLVRADLQAELLRIQRELEKTIVFVTHEHRRGVGAGRPDRDPGQGRPHRAGRYSAAGGGRAGGRLRGRLPGSRPRHPRPAPARDPDRHSRGGRPRTSGRPAGGARLMTWVLNNLELIGSRTLSHLLLAIPAIVASFVLALPLGWVANRYRWSRATLLTAAGLLYAIPSLPLFVVLPSVLGFGVRDRINVIVALTLYGLALMVRSAADALASVGMPVVLSSTALGYSAAGRFFAVELPLAGPVLLAGLRVVSVSTISLVTVSSLLGVDNLGLLFVDGFQRGIIAEVLTGIMATVALALIVDGLLVLAGRALMPWTKARR